MHVYGRSSIKQLFYLSYLISYNILNRNSCPGTLYPNKSTLPGSPKHDSVSSNGTLKRKDKKSSKPIP